MEETEENMSAEDVNKADSSSAVKKAKKRSIVERELETNMTAWAMSPATLTEGLSTSRYGRARRLKTEAELMESQKQMLAAIKTPGRENSPVLVQSPVYRMHASNSPLKAETPKKPLENYLDDQIGNIHQENVSLSRFADEGSQSPAKKFPKVYIRKDLIQNREPEEPIMLIKNLFSPKKSVAKSNIPTRKSFDNSSEKYNPKHNGQVDNVSVVKTLDFDGNKKRKSKDRKHQSLAKNELFELEAKCPYQVGDLAWARMGTFPFWPCIITREPYSEMFVKKKLFGRVEHDIIHVTFFGDNGRHSWIVDNMLRNYLGLLEFEATREKFTLEDKKKDPRLFAAFFVSEKKQALWNTSVEEAETLLREPKRLRIDIFNDMLWKFRASKKNQKSGKITRTDSDVSLSESLYDSLFSEDDAKIDDTERSKNKTRNKSFDVSEVVTACLDNMAAKTGITKIQRQSHMDRWLQKAKSKTPEKNQAKSVSLKVEKDKNPAELSSTSASDRNSRNKKKSSPGLPKKTSYRLRKSNESQTKLMQTTLDQSLDGSHKANKNANDSKIGINGEVESHDDKIVDTNGDAVICISEDSTDVTKQNKEKLENASESVKEVFELDKTLDNHKDSEIIDISENSTTVIKQKAKLRTRNYTETPKNNNKRKEIADVIKQKKEEINNGSDPVKVIELDKTLDNPNDSEIIDISEKSSAVTQKARLRTRSSIKTPKNYNKCNVIADVTKQKEEELNNGTEPVKEVIDLDNTPDSPKDSEIIDISEKSSAVTQKAKLRTRSSIKTPKSNNNRNKITSNDHSKIISLDEDPPVTDSKIPNEVKIEMATEAIKETIVVDIVQNTNKESKTIDVKQESNPVFITKGKSKVNIPQTSNKRTTRANSNKNDTKESINEDSTNTVFEERELNMEIATNLNKPVIEYAVEIQTNTDASETKHVMSSEITKTSVDLKVDELQDNCEASVKINNEPTKAPKINQIMEVDEIDDQKNGGKSNTHETSNNSNVESDEDTHFQDQKDEEISNLPETVSNENVEDLTDNNFNIKNDTILNEAQNITIEASVTEKKNDDTLNMAERRQKTDKQHSEHYETDFNNVFDCIKDNPISSDANIVKRNSVTHPNNTLTPEAVDTEIVGQDIIHCELEYDTKQNIEILNPSESQENKLSIAVDSKHEDTFTANESTITEYDQNTRSESIIQIENEVEDQNHKEPEINTSHHKSNQSDSILESCDTNENIVTNEESQNEDQNGDQNVDSKPNMSLNESSQSSSSLDSCNTNERIDTNDSEIEGTNNTKFNSTLEENNSTREYVESPTFTQLLESEEFFRDVNETYDTGHENNAIEKKFYETRCTATIEQKSILQRVEDILEMGFENKSETEHSSKIMEKVTEQIKTTDNIEEKDKLQTIDNLIAEIDNITHGTTVNNKTELNKCKGHKNELHDTVAAKSVAESIYEPDEEESDDEPSPEYESLDEDITEDFRKHMQSIEKNITDKKNEEQIVKICNEIAEKAKLSPTKYTKDVEATKPKESIDSSQKIPHDLKLSNHTATTSSMNMLVSKLNSEQLTSHNDKLESNFEKVIEPKIFKESQPQQKPIPIIAVADKQQVKENKKDKVAVNGNATLEEIAGSAKRSLRNRFSAYSVDDSPDSKIELHEIEPHLKSSGYDPKVVIIPLERDKIGTVKDNKTKLSSSDEKRKSKTRLSLKRDSPRSKSEEGKLDQNEIKLEDKPLSSSEDKKCEIVTLNKAPKKVNIEHGETKIPEPMVNGFRHEDKKCIESPDDTDFNIDAVSLNSEDSEISSTNSIESVPRRNLRSRPKNRSIDDLEDALRNSDFLEYLELRQDYLMDEHPELNEDEIVTYVYKTWQYEQDLKSDYKKSDEAHQSILVKGIKQETPSRKKSKKSQPKENIENNFREKYEKNKQALVVNVELSTPDSSETIQPKTPKSVESNTYENKIAVESTKRKTRSPDVVDLTPTISNDVTSSKSKDEASVTLEKKGTPKKTRRSNTNTMKSLHKQLLYEEKDDDEYFDTKFKKERDFDTESLDSESEVPLRQLRSKVLKENSSRNEKNTSKTTVELTPEPKESTQDTIPKKLSKESIDVKDEIEETSSTVSDNEPLLKQKRRKGDKKTLDDPEFTKYLELRQDALMDENPQLTQNEIVGYLYKTWLYEESSKSETVKNEELEQANLVKGLNNDPAPSKKVRRKPKTEKQTEDVDLLTRDKPRRKQAQPFYNENYSDIEDELEVFEIFKTKKTPITIVSKTDTEKDTLLSPKANEAPDMKSEIDDVKMNVVNETIEVFDDEEVEYVDAIELYFRDLTKPKPNVFKGLLREKLCDICEYGDNLVKCKGCHGMFHPNCVKEETKKEELSLPNRGRKKKKKVNLGRKPKSLDDSGSYSEDKSQDVSADMSIEEIKPLEIGTFDAESFEAQLETKIKELLDNEEVNYESYSSDDGIDWKDSVAGKCEIVDVKLKRRSAPIDYSDFKCNNCQKFDVPVCFVCRSTVSNDVKMRQKCHVAHCHKYYHLECLDHWPQTQFSSGEPSKSNKKISEFFETLSCPRHVCHTCVSDDPRGCKTRFSGDKLARCVRCPATYHSFSKCLPAGSQILTASHIICPRHGDQRPGKVPCHVNTGWCFICAQGGSLICCEYCPTSFHAECLNIKPPEGNYMCEDCETGRLPLYGEMVWVKLGHYRWWPGMILHPSEIPENIMAAKHGLGEFVVRFFGQYDHYWVNRGRVFPYQEGDSGRISGQKSKIDADFTLAIEHAQRAYNILKKAEPNEEESLDIASSLLPPHYVKLKCNKPCGSLCGRRIEDPSLSLTQCECDPTESNVCGPQSQCLNRMLLTECGPTCRAGERCNNRAFEKRQYPKLVPYRTPHRGWGLKTLEDVKAGQFVIEYVGELIDEDEFKRRMRRKHEIRDENFYFLTLDKERMIDAGPKGNLARFMNHCCEPNCETQKWTVLGDVRVGLFAIDDIPANSEVTFNYNLQCAGIEKKRCLCGAKRCSGYIGAKPKQEGSQIKKGKDGKLLPKRTYNKKKKLEDPSTKMKAKKPVGRPPKPKELTEIEKDLLIIKNATNENSSSDSSRSQSLEDKNPKTLKRKRVSISTDEVSICNGQEPSAKKQKCEGKEVGD